MIATILICDYFAGFNIIISMESLLVKFKKIDSLSTYMVHFKRQKGHKKYNNNFLCLKNCSVNRAFIRSYYVNFDSLDHCQILLHSLSRHSTNQSFIHISLKEIFSFTCVYYFFTKFSKIRE